MSSSRARSTSSGASSTLSASSARAASSFHGGANLACLEGGAGHAGAVAALTVDGHARMNDRHAAALLGRVAQAAAHRQEERGFVLSRNLLRASLRVFLCLAHDREAILIVARGLVPGGLRLRLLGGEA